MKLELPDGHPLAEAIRDAVTSRHGGRLILSLDRIGPLGVNRLFSMAIDQFSITETKTKRLEAMLTNLIDERREIESMTTWPGMTSETP